MDVVIHGADSETFHGRPMTLQFFSDDTEQEVCLWVDEHTATDSFFDWLETLPRKCLNLVYCHNLDFDLPEFFWSMKEELVTAGGAFEFTCDGWDISGVYGTPTFCKMRHRKRDISVMILDSFSWFTGSLAQAAKQVCPDLPKLKRPEGLGTRKFKVTDDDFYAYAMRDAEVAYHCGVWIQQLVREFDIQQPVSRADMAAKIFRKQFLQYTIPQPGIACIKGALKSYHGGKNNVISGAAPAWHLGVTSMDISSAYPYAMTMLPSMSYEKLYKIYPKREGRGLTSVPPLGVYRCSGTADKCEWPVVFHHGFDPIQGHFKNVWIQGFELNEALASGEVKIKSIRGYYYEYERDSRKSPFVEFVRDFYQRKQTEKDAVLRYMYKIILNSVYGKFIQTRKNAHVIYTDVDTGETEETCEVTAGGMFHPFIASAITAQTRAYIHQLEHAHNAIHTATDGIYTYRKRPVRVAHSPYRSDLGKVEVEAHGDLVLIRNKCYILYTDDGKIKSEYFRGKRINKYAKHGFQGSVFDLEKLVAHNERGYHVNKPNRLRQSLQRGLAVNEFVRKRMTLKVGKIAIYKR